MSRDMDLLRELLLDIEKLPSDGCFHDVGIHGRTEAEIIHHVMLLDEAGFVRTIRVSNGGRISWKSTSLTYRGREFLNTARSDVVWETAKRWTLKKAGTLTLEELRLSLRNIAKALTASSAEENQKAATGTV